MKIHSGAYALVLFPSISLVFHTIIRTLAQSAAQHTTLLQTSFTGARGAQKIPYKRQRQNFSVVNPRIVPAAALPRVRPSHRAPRLYEFHESWTVTARAASGRKSTE